MPMTGEQLELFERYKRQVLGEKFLEGVNFDEFFIRRLYSNLHTGVGDLIDGGANRGIHATYMGKLLANSAGRVVAVEAIPDIANLLRENIQEAGCANVTVIQAALSNYIGKTTYNFVRNADGLSGIKPRDNYHTPPELEIIEVDVVTLDKIVEDQGISPYFIKLDLEHGEFDGFRGGKNVLTNSRPVVAFENSLATSADIYGYDANEFFMFFEDIKYDLIDFSGCRVTTEYWNGGLMWQFIAYPRENSESFTSLVKSTMLQCLQAFEEG